MRVGAGIVLLLTLSVTSWWVGPTTSAAESSLDRFAEAGPQDQVSYAPDAGMVPLVPSRLLDTRDGFGAPAGAVAGGNTIELTVSGHGGVPTTGVGAVVMNVTAVDATAPSFVTVWPTGVDRPLASNLNVHAGDTIPNLVIVKVGNAGKVNLFNNTGNVHLVADVVGWFPDGHGSSISYALNVGSVVAGAGDVTFSTGDSQVGATVVLSGAADVPPVGGHLAVFPHSSVPGGVAGTVTSASPNGDGTTTVVLSPANLQDIFTSLDLTASGGASVPFSPGVPSRLALVENAQCSGSGPAPTLSVSIGGFGGTVDFSLARSYARIEVSATVSLQTSFSVSAAVSCTFPFPPITVGAFSPLIFDVQYDGVVTIGGQMAATSTLNVPVQIGFEYDHSSVTNLSDVNLTGSGDVGGAVISATVGAQLSMSSKLFGIVGLVASHGPEVVFTYDTGDQCVKIEARYRLGVEAEAGRWGVGWTISIAEFVVGPVKIFQLNCPKWYGSVAIKTSAVQPDIEFTYDSSYDLPIDGDPVMKWNLTQHQYTETGFCGRVRSDTLSTGSAAIVVGVGIPGLPYQLELSSPNRPEGDLRGTTRSCTVDNLGQGQVIGYPVTGIWYPYPISWTPCVLPMIPMGENAQAVRDFVECHGDGTSATLRVALKKFPCDETIDSDSDGTGDCAEYDGGGNPNG